MVERDDFAAQLDALDDNAGEGVGYSQTAQDLAGSPWFQQLRSWQAGLHNQATQEAILGSTESAQQAAPPVMPQQAEPQQPESAQPQQTAQATPEEAKAAAAPQTPAESKAWWEGSWWTDPRVFYENTIRNRLTPEQQQEWLKERVEQAPKEMAAARAALENAKKALEDLDLRTHYGQFSEVPQAYDPQHDPNQQRALLAGRVRDAQAELEQAQKHERLIQDIVSGKAPLPTETWGQNVLERGAHGAVSLVPQTTKYAGNVGGYLANKLGATTTSDQNIVYRLGDAVDEFVKERFPGDPARQADASSKIAEMAFNYGTLFGVSALARLGPAWMAKATPFVVGGVQGGQSQYEAAKKAGAPEESRMGAELAGTAVGAALMGIPVNRIFSAPTVQSGRELAMSALQHAGVNGAIGAGYSIANDIIARGFYDPKRQIGQNASEEAVMFALFGAGAHVIGQGMRSGLGDQFQNFIMGARERLGEEGLTPEQKAAFDIIHAQTRAERPALPAPGAENRPQTPPEAPLGGTQAPPEPQGPAPAAPQAAPEGARLLGEAQEPSGIPPIIPGQHHIEQGIAKALEENGVPPEHIQEVVRDVVERVLGGAETAGGEVEAQGQPEAQTPATAQPEAVQGAHPSVEIAKTEIAPHLEQAQEILNGLAEHEITPQEAFKEAQADPLIQAIVTDLYKPGMSPADVENRIREFENYYGQEIAKAVEAQNGGRSAVGNENRPAAQIQAPGGNARITGPSKEGGGGSAQVHGGGERAGSVTTPGGQQPRSGQHEQSGVTTTLGSDREHAYSRFLNTLAGSTPRKQWGRESGLNDAQIQEAVQRALQEGYLAPDSKGNPRRTAKAKQIQAPRQVQPQQPEAAAGPAPELTAKQAAKKLEDLGVTLTKRGNQVEASGRGFEQPQIFNSPQEAYAAVAADIQNAHKGATETIERFKKAASELGWSDERVANLKKNWAEHVAPQISEIAGERPGSPIHTDIESFGKALEEIKQRNKPVLTPEVQTSVESAIDEFQNVYGRLPSPDVMDYAAGIEASKGQVRSFFPILNELRADQNITAQDAVDLARLLGANIEDHVSKDDAVNAIENTAEPSQPLYALSGQQFGNFRVYDKGTDELLGHYNTMAEADAAAQRHAEKRGSAAVIEDYDKGIERSVGEVSPGGEIIRTKWRQSIANQAAGHAPDWMESARKLNESEPLYALSGFSPIPAFDPKVYDEIADRLDKAYRENRFSWKVLDPGIEQMAIEDAIALRNQVYKLAALDNRATGRAAKTALRRRLKELSKDPLFEVAMGVDPNTLDRYHDKLLQTWHENYLAENGGELPAETLHALSGFTHGPEQAVEAFESHRDPKLVRRTPQQWRKLIEARPGWKDYVDWTGLDDFLKSHEKTLEQPVKAAVSMDGQIFTGKHHGDAYDNAVKKLGIDRVTSIVDQPMPKTHAGRLAAGFEEKGYKTGFLTNEERFVNRNEAYKLLKKADPNNVIDITKPELDANHLDMWRNAYGSPKQATITKDELLSYMRAHSADLDEKVLGGGPNIDKIADLERQIEETSAEVDRLDRNDSRRRDLLNQIQELSYQREKLGGENPTKFEVNKIPGGVPGSYRELLIRDKSLGPRRLTPDGQKHFDAIFEEMGRPGIRLERYNELRKEYDKYISPKYTSKHFHDQEIAHIRFDDRIGPNGEKIGFVQEVQRDLEQMVRRFGIGEEGSRKAKEVTRNPGDHSDAAVKAAKEYLYHFGDKGAPNYAFKGDASLELALKRMLRYFVENGYDAISTARSDQIAKAVGADPESLKLQYDQKIPKFLDKYVKKWGAKVERETIPDLDDSSFEARLRQLKEELRRATPEQVPNRDALIEDVTRAFEQRASGRTPDAVFNSMHPQNQKYFANTWGENAGNPIIRITPQMRESVLGGQAYAKGYLSSANIRSALSSGQTAHVPDDVISEAHQAIEPHLGEVPRSSIIGTLVSIEPIGATEAKATFRGLDGREFSQTAPLTALLNSRALYAPDYRSLGIIHTNFPYGGTAESLRKSIAGRIAHENVHLLWILLTPSERRSLVSHANDTLKILDEKAGYFLKLIEDPNYVRATDGSTLRDWYEKDYNKYPNKKDLMNQESVAHAAELLSHILMLPEHDHFWREMWPLYAPVADIYMKMFRGEIAERGNPKGKASLEPSAEEAKSTAENALAALEGDNEPASITEQQGVAPLEGGQEVPPSGAEPAGPGREARGGSGGEGSGGNGRSPERTRQQPALTAELERSLLKQKAETKLITSLGLAMANIKIPARGSAEAMSRIGAAQEFERQGRQLMQALGFPSQLFGMAKRLSMAIDKLGGPHGRYNDIDKIWVDPRASDTTVAHEWWHFLDNYFGTFENIDALFKYMSQREGKVRPDYIAEGATDKFSRYELRTYPGTKVRTEVAQAFDHLYDAIFKGSAAPAKILGYIDRSISQKLLELSLMESTNKPEWMINLASRQLEDLKTYRQSAEQTLAHELQSRFVLRAKEQDRLEGDKKYWSDPAEFTARAFENYVRDRLGLGDQNQRLTGMWNLPASDKPAIYDAFDHLFATVKVRETPTGPELYAITAYHGSPHDFDRFDMSKIGTGEGAQAFGHGLYFAGNPATAEVYQKNLALAPAYLNRFGGDKEAAIAHLRNEETKLIATGARQEGIDQVRSIIKDLQNDNHGRLYEVNLDVEPHDLLDWDKPLNQQSDKVRDALKKLLPSNMPENTTGGAALDFLNKVDQAGGYLKNKASDRLREAGIPGIRYLDQGSRGSGEGSHNYVIFDHDKVRITAKDGEPVSPQERSDVINQTQNPEGSQPQYALAGQRGAENLADAGRPAARDAIELAEQLEAKGADRDEIWKATSDFLKERDPNLIGVFRGVDGKWRFEIDDSGASLTGRGAAAAPDVLKHDNLFATYPDLSNIDVYADVDERNRIYGKYQPYEEREHEGLKPLFEMITAQAPSQEKMKEVLGHEFQHYIQDKEGFAQGANPFNIIQERPLNPVEAHQEYQRHGGETEARNVEKRMNMTAEERRATPPWKTQDIPDEQQIIKHGNNGPQFALSGSGFPQQPVTPEVQDLSDAISEIRDALKLPETSGRYGISSKKARKASRRDTMPAAAKASEDLDTLSRTIPEALNKEYGKDLQDLMKGAKDELIPISNARSPDRLSSGFDEFMRHYLRNPAQAWRMAPKFFEDFEDFLDANDPRLRQAFDELHQAVIKPAARDALTAAEADPLFQKTFGTSREELFARAKASAEPYTKALETYNAGKDVDLKAANQALRQAPDKLKTYVQFNQNRDVSKLHPIVRAREIANIVHGMTREILANQLRDTSRAVSQRVYLGPEKAREINGLLMHFTGAEANNAFSFIGTKEFAGSKEVSAKSALNKIKDASPKVYEELQRRLKKANIQPWDTIKGFYPAVSKSLNKAFNEAAETDQIFDALRSAQAAKKDIFGPGPYPSTRPQNLGVPKETKSFASAFKKFWVNVFAPEMQSENALWADARFGQYAASSAQAKDELIARMDETYKRWLRVPEQERLDFMNAVETNKISGLPQWQREEAANFRNMLDKAFQVEEQWGSKATFREDYMPHIFKDAKGFKDWLDTRLAIQSLGPTWFQKPRFFDLIKEALDHGFELKTTNPADLVTLRLLASIDMQERAKLLHSLQDNYNLARQYKAINDPAQARDLTNEGWFKIVGPDREVWLIAPDVSALWHNAIEAKGLWANEGWVGDTFRGLMSFKNAVIPIKLGLSFFHTMHVLGINVAWHLRQALSAAAHGDLYKAGEGIINMSLGSFTSKAGREGRAAWMKPAEERKPDEQFLVDLMTWGTFSPQMSEQMRIMAKRGFQQAMADRNPLKMLWFGFKRGQERFNPLQHYLMERWIPVLKTGAYINRARDYFDRHPERFNDVNERALALRTIAKETDNAFGHMFYQGDFMNKILADSLKMSLISWGWQKGYTRTYIGGLISPVARALELAQGKEPSEARKIIREAQQKTSYQFLYFFIHFLAFLGISALIGGRKSEDLTSLDGTFPLIGGGLNPDGSERRLTNASFNREPAMWLKHYQEQGGGLTGAIFGTLDMAKNKSITGIVTDPLLNRDYFHREIYNPESNILPRVDHIIKQLYAEDYKGALKTAKDSKISQILMHQGEDIASPITVSGAKRAVETGGSWNPYEWGQKPDVPLAFLGFGPAPSYVSKTATQNRIAYLWRQGPGAGVHPYEEIEKDEGRMKATQAYKLALRANNADQIRAAEKAMKDAGAKRRPTLDSDVNMFHSLKPSQQRAILDGATPEELPRYVNHVSAELANDPAFRLKYGNIRPDHSGELRLGH